MVREATLSTLEFVSTFCILLKIRTESFDPLRRSLRYQSSQSFDKAIQLPNRSYQPELCEDMHDA